jgi:cytoskeleton protein RodZ
MGDGMDAGNNDVNLRGRQRGGSGRIHFRELSADQAGEAHYTGIGADLRAERERRSMTIDAAASDLRLQKSHLLALEEGRVEDLPGAAYAIGFLRSYARFLDMDAEAAVRRFKEEEAVRADPTRLVFPDPIGEARRPGWRLAIVSLLVLGAAYGGWWYLQRQGDLRIDQVSDLPENLREKASATEVPAVVPTETETKSASPAETQVAAASSEATASVVADADETAAEAGSAQGGEAMRIERIEPTRVEVALREGETAVGEQAEPTTQSREGERAAALDASAVRGEAEPSGEASGTRVASSVSAEDREPASVAASDANGAGANTPAPDNTPHVSVAPDVSRPVVEAVPQDRMAETAAPATGPSARPNAAAAVQSSGPTPSSFAVVDGAVPPNRLPTESADDGDRISAPVTVASVDTSAPPPSPAATPSTVPVSPSVEAYRPQAYGVADTNARVVIRARADSWVQVQGPNNELLLTRILRAGDAYYAPDRSDLVLMTGNAGAIEVIVDGEVIGPLGPEGEVRRGVNLFADDIRATLQRRNPNSP